MACGWNAAYFAVMRVPDRGEIGIVVLDALLGVIIGSISMATGMVRMPHRTFDLQTYAGAAHFSMFFFGVPFFLATLLCAPFMVRYLRHRLHQPRRQFYRVASTAGVGFGVAASAAVGLFFPLMLALVPNGADQSLTDRVLLTLLGPLLLVPGALFTALIAFGIELLVFGILFGLLNAWLVRRAWPSEAAP